VFDDSAQAYEFAEEIQDEFPGHVLILRFAVGYKYTDRSVGFSGP
jgi:hypothetical protein